MGVPELFFSLPTREVMQAIWAVKYTHHEKRYIPNSQLSCRSLLLRRDKGFTVSAKNRLWRHQGRCFTTGLGSKKREIIENGF